LAVALREAIDPLSEQDRSLRIAFLGYRSNPYSGGQGIYIKYLTRALVDLGHEVDVISGEPYPDLDERVGLIRLPGLNMFAVDNQFTALRRHHLRSATDLIEWGSKITGGFAEPYTFGRRLKRDLLEALRGYDVVHDNQSLCWALLDLQSAGIPLVSTIHHPITWDRDIALAHEQRWHYRLLIRRWHHFLRMQIQVAQRLKHIVTVSERSRRDIARAFAIPEERIDVIYNGIDTQTFAPVGGVARNPCQLITTASADQPLKGTQHLIPAFAQLRRSFPDLRLTFIGRPKEDGVTAGLIERHGVEDAIDFVHGISTCDIVELYARATVAVVPSEYEGFGLPAGEAMACGVPVVSTDGGALPEVVGDAGVIVPAGNPPALAKAIADLLRHPERQETLGRAGREHIVRHFSWRDTAEGLINLYRAVRA
jgi:glycosyltransferase involved in cell wall biosynthesis|tara:strand:+ start:388 stop:1662 length:1275 start_codon:yes stop_codon:yes gene_type:complete